MWYRQKTAIIDVPNYLINIYKYVYIFVYILINVTLQNNFEWTDPYQCYVITVNTRN